jgi:biopolymer transport protein ExbD
MKKRRLRKTPAHLEITAFINLIVVLVPFLLSTAVFSRLAVMDINLPAQQAAVEQLKTNDLQLEIVVRKDAFEVGDRIGGLLQRIERGATPEAEAKAFTTLGSLLVMVKQRFPDKREASLLAEPEVPYDTLVHAMDAMRGTITAQGTQLVRAELFPVISIGDAPLRKGAAMAAAPAGGAVKVAAARGQTP